MLTYSIRLPEKCRLCYKMCEDDNMTRKELMNETDILKGNINRMMVTDDNEELLRMYAFALERLGKIYRHKAFELIEIERESDIPRY